MKYDEFVSHVSARAGVPPDRAAVLTRVTLTTLAERITGGEARDLASQLPKDLQTALIPPQEPAEKFDLAEFVRRVKGRAEIDDEETAREGVRAVFLTLAEAVTGGQFRDVMSQLPREFRELVEPAHH
jgi:uncharacterized protein (DUF2267 family)